MQVADGPMQIIENKKMYVYKLNFSCLADSIDEADACMAKETSLTYQKGKPPHLCPLISCVITAAPKDGGGAIIETRTHD